MSDQGSPVSLLSPVVLDADALKQIAIDFLAAQIGGGWTNTPGDELDLALTAVAQMMSYGLAQYGDPTDAIVTAVGTVVYKTPPFSPVSAATTSTWVTDGTAGTIPGGTYVAASDADGNPVEMQVAEDVDVAVTVTSTSGVRLVVSEPGAAGNGLTGAAHILDRVAFALSCTLDAPTDGGVDPESSAAYGVRISELANLIAPRLILPQDFANGARLLVPGVARALAIDEYDADTDTSDVERCVTVAVLGPGGTLLSSGLKDQIEAEFVARRETTFLSFVIDPTFTNIAIAYAGVAEPGYDPAGVNTAADQALLDFLSAAKWGIPANGDLSQWLDRPLVRYQDVVTALNNVDGFDHYTTLTVNAGTADVALTGPAGLPNPSISSSSVVAP